ncbi:MAG: hypothetical protein IPF46_17150 [Saprospiraceae bacterium]|nr:hypothetical protein [Candidatus Vicinibacter affinis]MBK7800915.1 hypothetical protein [Candidatus Vicinibacter affinis]MBP6174323.1 hypothetical protein [Saprospiraceae bacterium]
MKKTLLILTVTTLTAALGTTACNFGTKNPQTKETNQTADTVQTRQVHPIIESIFYNLPLENSRLDLREVIVNDKRFILTDTTFNDYQPSSFFKGITADKGLIKSNPDSIQVMLIYGNAALVTEKGGQEDSTKHPMILECKYFFSNKDRAEMEYGRILNLVHPIFTDTSSIMDDKWEAQFSKSTEKCIGKIFDHFDPYYRVGISYISVIPVDGSKPIFVLDIAFSKEDK